MRNFLREFGKAKRAAFSLVELLVVIAIIAILAGVLMASFGGARDSARAAVCLTNMKALAQAANSYAMSSGYYPLAGSREAIGAELDEDSAGLYYTPQVGWISWLDQGKYDDGNGNARSKSHVKNKVCPFYGSGDEDQNTYAITNGSLWIACGKNRNIYTCPEHIRYRAEHSKSRPLWSYVMSSKFGYDYSRGSKAVVQSKNHGIDYNSLSRADRTLMFAELPRAGVNSGSDEEEEYASDAVLNYKGSIGGKNYKTAEWSGTAEEIGFPHKTGKRGYCGHVVYADGHTETLHNNLNGLSMDIVTTLLCEGIDVAYNESKGYQLPDDADETNEDED